MSLEFLLNNRKIEFEEFLTNMFLPNIDKQKGGKK